MSPDFVQLVLITVVTAATPLCIAAIGELVTERSGILNLGVEGMMIVGAATGFAAAYLSDSTLVGRFPASWPASRWRRCSPSW